MSDVMLAVRIDLTSIVSNGEKISLSSTLVGIGSLLTASTIFSKICSPAIC